MSERMVAPISSLLKYDNPVLIREPSAGRQKKTPPTSSTGKSTTSTPINAPKPAAVPSHPSPPSSRSLKTDNRPDNRKEAQDAINTVLPPKEWKEDDQLWRQQVSSTPATRLDVLSLQEQLESRLKQRQARDIGICPVRRELYSQCFDELIRQVTISCAERGFLLARVRDELNLTLLSYQTLYESSLAFGVRKALQAEVGRTNMESSISSLQQECNQLRETITALQVDLERNCRQSREDAEALRTQHVEEVELLQRSNQQLKSLLEGVLTNKK